MRKDRGQRRGQTRYPAGTKTCVEFPISFFNRDFFFVCALMKDRECAFATTPRAARAVPSPFRGLFAAPRVPYMPISLSRQGSRECSVKRTLTFSLPNLNRRLFDFSNAVPARRVLPRHHQQRLQPPPPPPPHILAASRQPRGGDHRPRRRRRRDAASAAPPSSQRQRRLFRPRQSRPRPLRLRILLLLLLHQRRRPRRGDILSVVGALLGRHNRFRTDGDGDDRPSLCRRPPAAVDVGRFSLSRRISTPCVCFD